jgi:hypothetical protein
MRLNPLRNKSALKTIAVLMILSFSCACSGGGSNGSGAPASSTTSTTNPASSTAPASSPGPAAPASPAAPAALASGAISALSYNVAGLPLGLSSSSPAANTPQISPKLNSYDLVFAQEDFSFHGALARDANHSFQSQPLTGYLTPMGDGLNRFSNFPFSNLTRKKWLACHGLFNAGSDCLASKGFSFARADIAPGVTIDFYNLHADAGRGSKDKAARTKQFDQLTQFIWLNSLGQPIIVVGDTNLKAADSDDEKVLQDFLTATGLQVSARVLGQLPDSIDRLMYRGAGKVTITPINRRIATEFVDANGNDLSDHKAIHVDFRWELFP